MIRLKWRCDRLSLLFTARSDRLMGKWVSTALGESPQFADVTRAGFGTKTHTHSQIDTQGSPAWRQGGLWGIRGHCVIWHRNWRSSCCQRSFWNSAKTHWHTYTLTRTDTHLDDWGHWYKHLHRAHMDTFVAMWCHVHTVWCVRERIHTLHK